MATQWRLRLERNEKAMSNCPVKRNLHPYCHSIFSFSPYGNLFYLRTIWNGATSSEIAGSPKNFQHFILLYSWIFSASDWLEKTARFFQKTDHLCVNWSVWANFSENVFSTKLTHADQFCLCEAPCHLKRAWKVERTLNTVRMTFLNCFVKIVSFFLDYHGLKISPFSVLPINSLQIDRWVIWV